MTVLSSFPGYWSWSNESGWLCKPGPAAEADMYDALLGPASIASGTAAITDVSDKTGGAEGGSAGTQGAAVGVAVDGAVGLAFGGTVGVRVGGPMGVAVGGAVRLVVGGAMGVAVGGAMGVNSGAVLRVGEEAFLITGILVMTLCKLLTAGGATAADAQAMVSLSCYVTNSTVGQCKALCWSGRVAASVASS